jgi:hypothetical protein
VSAGDKFTITSFAMIIALHDLGEGRPVLSALFTVVAIMNAVAFIAIIARRLP